MWLLWWMVAFAACAAVFYGTGWLLDRRADHRWARMMRANERRELRRSAWAEMSRLGGRS